MFLRSNIVIQLGFSLNIEKTLVQMMGDLPKEAIQTLKNNTLPIAAIVKNEKNDLQVFPRHYMNTLIYWDKYSKVPISELKKGKMPLWQKHPVFSQKCIIEDKRVKSSFSHELCYEIVKSTPLTQKKNETIPDNSIVWFEPKNQNLVSQITPEQAKKIFLLNKLACKNYALFIATMNYIHEEFPKNFRGINPAAAKSDLSLQCVTIPDQTNSDRFYLAKNFLVGASIDLKFMIDSTGRAKEMRNFFVPISYESIYLVFQAPIFGRVLLRNSTLLSTEILAKLLRRYFLVKLGVSADLLGIEITVDPKGIYDVSQSSFEKKKDFFIALLKCFFRSFTITVRKKICIINFTFDFYSMSFTIAVSLFPLRYSAYIDKHGKKPGTEILSTESPQVTYY